MSDEAESTKESVLRPSSSGIIIQRVVVVLLCKFNSTVLIIFFSFFVIDVKSSCRRPKIKLGDRNRGLFIESLGNYGARKTVLCLPCLYLLSQFVMVLK